MLERTFRRLATRYGHLLARRHDAWLARSLAAACEWFLHAYKNRSYDIARNGERRVVQSLRLGAGMVALDVGANVGDYSAVLRECHPEATIHAFEINPAHAEGLVRRFGNDPRVHLHLAGLGEMPVYELAADSSFTSVYRVAMDEDVPTRVFVAPIRPGAEVLDGLGIDEVHFLKIDTEGHDLAVLKGFRPRLAAGRIHVIQFEYNESSVPARTFLRDFFELLQPFGYEIGKVYPWEVAFGPYRLDLEDHRASNYVAVGPGPFARLARARLASPAAGCFRP
jgi:FkbM family methyltransferase